MKAERREIIHNFQEVTGRTLLQSHITVDSGLRRKILWIFRVLSFIFALMGGFDPVGKSPFLGSIFQCIYTHGVFIGSAGHADFNIRMICTL